MVTLKVLSVEYIIETYLRSLGWKKDFGKAVAAVLENGVSGEHDILMAIDRILLKKAEKVFEDRRQCANKEQLTALFKYCFLICNGAKKWGEIIFRDNSLPQGFIDDMTDACPEIVPHAKSCKMKQQKIESYTVGGIIKKLFGKREK